MKIKQIQLTKAIFVPTVGQLPATIGTVHCLAEMETTDHGILCTAKGGVFLIPYSMVETAYICPTASKKVDNVKEASKKV